MVTRLLSWSVLGLAFLAGFALGLVMSMIVVMSLVVGGMG